MNSSVRKIWVKIERQWKVFPFILTDKSYAAFLCCETPDYLHRSAVTPAWRASRCAGELTASAALGGDGTVKQLAARPAGLRVSVLPWSSANCTAWAQNPSAIPAVTDILITADDTTNDSSYNQHSSLWSNAAFLMFIRSFFLFSLPLHLSVPVLSQVQCLTVLCISAEASAVKRQLFSEVCALGYLETVWN